MKYILIKRYPGSPKLGTIRKYEGNVWSDSNEFTSPIINPENYPEFWELVVEYPIGTKVHNSQTNTTYTKKEDGWYKPSEKTGYNDEMIIKSHYINIIEDKVVEKDYEILSYITIESELIKYKDLDINDDLNCDKYLKIHSVKRLSDGEIFIIGDIIDTRVDNKYKQEILEISIKNNTIVFRTKLGFVILSVAKKVKQPLFTTEDGVDIFEGDTYYKVVNESFQLLIMERAPKGKSLRSKVFSTKEKAEEYILMNKPVLSLNDIKNLNREYETIDRLMLKIKNLVKLKIQQSV